MECRHVYQRGPKRGQTCGQQCRGEYCWKHKPANIEQRKEYYREKYRKVPKCTIEVLRSNCHREIADKLAKADKLAVDNALGPRHLGPNSIAEAAHDEIDRCNKKPRMLWVISTYNYLLDQKIDRITLKREIAMMSFRKLKKYVGKTIDKLCTIVFSDYAIGPTIFSEFQCQLNRSENISDIHELMVEFAMRMNDEFANKIIINHDRELNVVMEVWKKMLDNVEYLDIEEDEIEEDEIEEDGIEEDGINYNEFVYLYENKLPRQMHLDLNE